MIKNFLRDRESCKCIEKCPTVGQRSLSEWVQYYVFSAVRLGDLQGCETRSIISG